MTLIEGIEKIRVGVFQSKCSLYLQRKLMSNPEGFIMQVEMLANKSLKDIPLKNSILAYADNPIDPKLGNQMLIRVQHDVIPEMKITEWAKNHPDFYGVVNKTLVWLINLSNKNEEIPLFELELNSNALSLRKALADAIYAKNLSYKLKDLCSVDCEPRMMKERKKIFSNTTKNISKFDTEIVKLKNPLRIDFKDQNKGSDTSLQIPNKAIYESGLDTIANQEFWQSFFMYLSEDPDSKLTRKRSRKYLNCNCHEVLKLKIDNPNISMSEIAKSLNISDKGDVPDYLWKTYCISCIEEIFCEFKNQYGMEIDFPTAG
jgi:hypothetical protein